MYAVRLYVCFMVPLRSYRVGFECLVLAFGLEMRNSGFFWVFLFFSQVLCHLFPQCCDIHDSSSRSSLCSDGTDFPHLCIFLLADIHWHSSCICQSLQRAGYLHSDPDAALPRGELLWTATSSVSRILKTSADMSIWDVVPGAVYELQGCVSRVASLVNILYSHLSVGKVVFVF